MRRLKNIINSYRGMPLWVQLWIGLFLAPANIACVFFLDTEVGTAVAYSGIGVLMFNGILCWLNQGFSKVLALPHLLFWGPLQFYLAFLLWPTLSQSPWSGNDASLYFAGAVFLFNGISLAFDVFDSIDWLKGQREIAGHPDLKPVV